MLLLVPYDTPHDDVVVRFLFNATHSLSLPFLFPQVVIESNYLLAGVKGQEPIVKVRLFCSCVLIDSTADYFPLVWSSLHRANFTVTSTPPTQRGSSRIVLHSRNLALIPIPFLMPAQRLTQRYTPLRRRSFTRKIGPSGASVRSLSCLRPPHARLTH